VRNGFMGLAEGRPEAGSRHNVAKRIVPHAIFLERGIGIFAGETLFTGAGGMEDFFMIVAGKSNGTLKTHR